MTQKNYVVHSVADTVVNRTVTVDGQQVGAQVPACVIEFTPVDAGQGTLTWMFIGADVEGAKAAYPQGASVTISIAAVTPPSP